MRLPCLSLAALLVMCTCVSVSDAAVRIHRNAAVRQQQHVLRANEPHPPTPSSPTLTPNPSSPVTSASPSDAVSQYFKDKKLPPLPPRPVSVQTDACGATAPRELKQSSSGSGSGSGSDAKVNAKVKAQIARSKARSFLETRAGTDADTDADASVSQSTRLYPPHPVPTVGASIDLATVRQHVRPGIDNGIGPCAPRMGLVGVWLPVGGAHTTEACYYHDPTHPHCVGCVSIAYVQDVVTGGTTAAGDLARQYCDVLFDPTQIFGPWLAFGLRTPLPGLPLHYATATYAKVFEVGHIVAAQLGGTNGDPINFFPQYRNSNAGAGSPWAFAEDMAAAVKTECMHLMTGAAQVTMPHACQVTVEIQFDYNGVTDMPIGVTNQIVPSGGRYMIWLQPADFTAMFPGYAMHASAANPMAGNVLWFLHNNMCQPPPFAPPTPVCAVQLPWLNI